MDILIEELDVLTVLAHFHHQLVPAAGVSQEVCDPFRALLLVEVHALAREMLQRVPDQAPGSLFRSRSRLENLSAEEILNTVGRLDSEQLPLLLLDSLVESVVNHLQDELGVGQLQPPSHLLPAQLSLSDCLLMLGSLFTD